MSPREEIWYYQDSIAVRLGVLKCKNYMEGAFAHKNCINYLSYIQRLSIVYTLV